jgi:LPXTG-motif cell wall-anchored protein
MARLATSLGAVVLACCAIAGVASANVDEGGASAPRAAGDDGGLTAPAEGVALAGPAQADDPDADAPDVDQPAPSPVEPAPDSDAPAPSEPEPGGEPPAADDRGVDVVVPLPGEPAGERSPTSLATPTVALPRTGQDTGVVALIGLSLLAAGGALRLLSRRARAASA